MITVISSSNREGNLTSVFSKRCAEVLTREGHDVKVYNLSSLPDEISLHSIYDFDSSEFLKIAEKFIAPADKLLFVVPEYNGSFPGILKLFIDAIHPSYFKNKKAALVGTAAGRAGNLRGMDHLTDILHHLQVHVMPQKLPISQLNGLLEGKKIKSDEALAALDVHLKLFAAF